MLQEPLPESGGPTSACSSWSLPIEGVCSELVQTQCFWFSHRGVARLSNHHFTFVRVEHCLIKSCLLATCTRTRRRRKRGRKREGLLAHAWRIKCCEHAGTRWAFSSPGNNSWVFHGIDIAPSKKQPHKKTSRMSSHSMREASSSGGFIIPKCPQKRVDH